MKVFSCIPCKYYRLWYLKNMHAVLELRMKFLNQACAGLWPARAWFLEIVFMKTRAKTNILNGNEQIIC